jgi:predicted CoA-binding protein
LKTHPAFTAHGYAVSPERPDCRVTIEGIEKAGRLTTEEVIDIVNDFRGADELEITSDYARCWYD